MTTSSDPAVAETVTAQAAASCEKRTAEYPHLPPMEDAAGNLLPVAPENLDQTGVNPDVLRDLALKLGNTVPTFTTEWASEQLCLPLQLVEELCWQLKHDKLVEILGQHGVFSHKYTVSGRGRELAQRLMEFSGYIGPAPVSLEAYSAMLVWESSLRPQIEMQEVQDAISSLVLPEDAVNVAALAAASGRSLFLFGPPGNGKTSVGKLLHGVMTGGMWIPHCIVAGSGSIIRLYDSQCHKPADDAPDSQIRMDRRWLRVQRPFVVAGGEMTMAELDLAYSPSLRFYEAPPHMKANGGTFLIDDFGRQRIAPEELLNRWIIPLEHRIDHFTLHTGQKIQLPFRLMLIVATNLSVSDVADPAFLRRMGYRLHLACPSEEDYRKIFIRYANGYDMEVETELLDWLLARYEAESRELRSSEPRDLVERARDVCTLKGQPMQLNKDIMNVAWVGYFGNM